MFTSLKGRISSISNICKKSKLLRCFVHFYCVQEGMQNQVNMNQVNMNQVNMNQVSMNVETSSTTNQPQFIIQGIPAIQGGVVNLAELLNKANAGTNTQKHSH